MTDRRPLYASEEKTKRAKSKLGYLKEIINGYVASKPHDIITKKEPDAVYVIASRTKDIPAECAWELVEAVNHLRGALDKIVIDLVDLNQRGTSGVAFPFGGYDRSTGKPDAFPNKRMEDGIKKKLTPEQWDLIAAQRPYPGGNTTLWAINEIANADKHRKGLVEVRPHLAHGAGISATYGGELYGDGRTIVNPTDRHHVLDDKERQRVLLAIEGYAINLQIDSEVAEGVVFGELPPVTRRDILVTLEAQIGLVEGIIESFRKKFF